MHPGGKACQILGIVAGKGGVGKSTVAVNLALAFAASGLRVGMIDADIYGPSLQKMLGVQKPLEECEGKLIPAVGLGISYLSAAFFHSRPGQGVVRSPIANHFIHQFLTEIAWGELDYLLVDFPPGTGDVQITLLQQLLFDGIIAVTTPQEVSLLDVRKSIHMVVQFGVSVLGLVENMSYFLDSHGEKVAPFGRGGGEKLAREFAVPLLSRIPIDSAIASCCDRSLSLIEEDSVGSRAFWELSRKIRGWKDSREEQEEPPFEVVWHGEKREV